MMRGKGHDLEVSEDVDAVEEREAEGQQRPDLLRSPQCRMLRMLISAPGGARARFIRVGQH